MSETLGLVLIAIAAFVGVLATILIVARGDRATTPPESPFAASTEGFQACPACGRPNAPGDRTCTYCGGPLRDAHPVG